MKMETPFSGTLAVLGVQGRGPHVLRVDGNWELRPGAVVYHQTRIGELEFGGATVIGEIQRLEVALSNPEMQPCLWAHGLGTTWLAELLDAGTHALSMEMRELEIERMGADTMFIVGGQVRAALLVRADDFGWKKKEEVGL